MSSTAERKSRKLCRQSSSTLMQRASLRPRQASQQRRLIFWAGDVCHAPPMDRPTPCAPRRPNR
eukprot:1332797-Karenia_brevis.AAC.1